MRRLFGCLDIVSLTEKFLMARNLGDGGGGGGAGEEGVPFAAIHTTRDSGPEDFQQEKHLGQSNRPQCFLDMFSKRCIVLP